MVVGNFSIAPAYYSDFLPLAFYLHPCFGCKTSRVHVVPLNLPLNLEPDKLPKEDIRLFVNKQWIELPKVCIVCILGCFLQCVLVARHT